MARWKWDKLFLSYLAGFVDGEGTISVQKRKRNQWYCFDPYIAIPNTNFHVLEYIHNRIGFGSFRTKISTKGHFGKKPVFSLWWSNRQAKKVIKSLYPYLKVKKPQAKLVLDMPVRGGTFSPKEENKRKLLQNQTYKELKILHGRVIN